MKREDALRVLELVGIVLIALGGILAGTSYAELQQQVTNKIYLNPFYTPAMTNGVWYNFTVDISPPSLYSVDSAIITIDAFNSPSINYSLLVNGKKCNTDSYYISTTYAGAGGKRILFDCSNAFSAEGIYNVSIRVTSANAGATTAYLEITYTSEPRSTITQHGTEYREGDIARVWLQLLNSSGGYVSSNQSICLLDVYKPDNTRLVEGERMSYIEDGVFYWDYPLPTNALVGVYTTISQCWQTVGSTNTKFLNVTTILNGTLKQNTVNQTYAVDAVYYRIDTQAVAGGQYVRVNASIWNLSSVFGQTQIVFDLWGRWNGAGGTNGIEIYVFNFSSGQYIKLPNILPITGGTDTEVTNTLSITNLTNAGLINSQRQMNILFNGTSTGGGKVFDIDYFALQLIGLTNGTWQVTRGSSEMHVTEVEENKFYDVQGLSGVENSDGAVYNYSETLPEGLLIDNVTVTPLKVPLDDAWVYETSYPIDCLAVLNVMQQNGSSWIDVTSTATLKSNNGQSCTIEVPLQTFGTATENYIIVLDNFQNWEVMSTQSAFHNVNQSVYPYCSPLANYTIPANGTGWLNTTPTINWCHHFLDDAWWWNNYYDTYQTTLPNAGTGTSYVGEARLYRELWRQYLQFYLVNITQATSISSQDVWTYNNRTLTNYNLSGVTANQNRILTDIAQVNTTVTAINTTSNSILSYLQGFVTTTLNNIYSTVLQTFNLSLTINNTVTAINAKNYTPTIIVNTTVNVTVQNVTNNYNTTQVFNYTQNITVSPVFNVTVQNVTNNYNNTFNYSYLTENNNTFVYNYTNIYNSSYLTENNFTIVYNSSYLTENNFTIVYNATYNYTYNYSYLTENNFTIVYNNTQNVTVVVTNTTNIYNYTYNYSYLTENNNTFVYNYSYLTENNFTVVINNSYLTENNFTIVYNNTYNTTYNYSYLTENNFTVVYNYTQNVTFVLTPTFNVTVNNSELLPYLTEINTTTQNTYSYLTTTIYPLLMSMNGTLTYIQGVVDNIYSVVLSIQTTVGNIFNLSTEINTTVGAINFTPTIVVNVTEINTTNIYNYSYLTENNNTFVYNYTYLTENNNTFVYNYSYLTENNFTVLYNYSYLTENNFTVVYNSTYNYTFNYSYLTENNFTIVYNNTQNITFAPVINTTTVTVQNVTLDYEQMAGYVWNSTINGRTLTDYNSSTILGYLNSINATVTEINGTVSVINGTVAIINGQTYEINQTVWQNNGILVAINNSLVPNTVYIW